ncbi:MAG: hypothetical protein U1B83_03100, partial [Candidatus Cloacimonadaceae bacterium]|nr:hypothetical protein [Candidatus Cloacimonadaceae bacterium]
HTNGYGNRNGGYKFESQQYEVGIKYLLKHKDKSYWSVLPSVFLVKGFYRDNDPHNLHDDVYNVTGFETHLLYTYLSSKYLSSSLIGRGTVNNIRINSFGQDLSGQTTYHFGTRANLRLSLWNLHQTTEIGFEVVPVVNGRTHIIHNLSAGLGLQF